MATPPAFCADSVQAGEMTPRQSAAVHLPELAQTFDRLKAVFGPGVTLECLTTPDGTWGADPTADWPRLVDPQPLPQWPPRR